ncbi:MAG TPA: CvpA family protein [Chitinophagaceae bacterium]|nr:CvpA family protein [Chitinophagaceae bacterium]
MVIDLLFALFMLLAIFNGFSKGFVLGLFSVITLLVALILAIKFSTVFLTYARGHFHLVGSWWPLIFFILLFVIAVVLISWVGRLITKLLELALLGWLNRLCGIIFYIAIYTVTFSVLLWLADRVHLISDSEKTGSWVYSRIAFIGPRLISIIGDYIPHFHHLMQNLADLFDRMASRPH